MRLLFFLAFAPGCILLGQSNAFLARSKADYVSVKNLMIRSAEKMPEAAYDFKPAPEVRTFGQIVAHVADDQYNLCAPVKHETRRAAYAEIEHTLTKKADLVAALKQAFAYCDTAYDAATEASATDLVKFGNSDLPALSMLSWNTWHTWEHYGNIVVYLRIKGIVPPSSERKP